MTIDNFNDLLPDWLLNRGETYYYENRIENFEFNNNLFTANIRGTRKYKVSVTLDSNGIILDSTCNCPFEGDICKHEIAMYFEIRDWISRSYLQNDLKEVSCDNKNDSLTSILNTKTKQELIKMIEEIADIDYKVYQQIKFKINQKTNQISLAQDLIHQYIYENSKKGYVAWDDVSKATKGFDIVLRTLDYNDNNTIHNLDILLMMIKEIKYLSDSSDDASGELALTISQILDQLKMLVENAVKKNNRFTTNKIFSRFKDFLVTNSANDLELIFDELIMIIILLLNSKEKRMFIDNYLDNLINVSPDYYKNYILIIKYNIIQMYDSDIEQENFISKNIDENYFRKLAIENAISKKNYPLAIILSEEGIEKGIYRDGEVDLLRIYKITNDIKNIRKYALKLFESHNNKEYYLALKNTFTSLRLWQEQVEILKQNALKQANSFDNRRYEFILIEEHLDKELLDYCKKNGNKVLELYNYISIDYKDETIPLLKTAIECQIQQVNGKKSYLKLRNHITNIGIIGGQNALKGYLMYLRINYKNRPSLLEVLKEIGKEEL